MTKNECIKILEEFEPGDYMLCRTCIQTRKNKLTCDKCDFQKAIKKAIKIIRGTIKK